jgi:hypothetical protein
VAEFLSVEDVVGSNGSKSLKSFGEKGDRSGGSPGVLAGVGSSGVCKCGNEWCCPCSFPKGFSVWAVEEACS